MQDEMPFLKILGSRVHIVQNPQVLSMMEHWIESGRQCHFIVNTGFHGLWTAYKDKEFKRILNSCDLFSPDGIAPFWIARARGIPLQERASSAELMKLFFTRANDKGYRSFFYGDTEETLSALKERLEAQYLGHKIVGVYSPPFRPLTAEEDEEVIKMINDAAPDVLWVGLGLPKQERWIYEHKNRLRVPVAIGVGACFGFFSGKVKRAPAWVGNHGFEWVWRLMKEPKKLWRRNLLEVPKFVTLAFLETIGLRKYD